MAAASKQEGELEDMSKQCASSTAHCREQQRLILVQHFGITGTQSAKTIELKASELTPLGKLGQYWEDERTAAGYPYPNPIVVRGGLCQAREGVTTGKFVCDDPAVAITDGDFVCNPHQQYISSLRCLYEVKCHQKDQNL